MHILIVEDNDIKYDLICACLEDARRELSIERGASYQSGLRLLLTAKPAFDFVVLDMTLPAYDIKDGSVFTNTLTFGGELILRESLRREIRAKFAVLTQYDVFLRDRTEVTFDNLRTELIAKFPSLVVDCVKMDTTSIAWKGELIRIIEQQ